MQNRQQQTQFIPTTITYNECFCVCLPRLIYEHQQDDARIVCRQQYDRIEWVRTLEKGTSASISVASDVIRGGGGDEKAKWLRVEWLCAMICLFVQEDITLSVGDAASQRPARAQELVDWVVHSNEPGNHRIDLYKMKIEIEIEWCRSRLILVFANSAVVREFQCGESEKCS